MIYSRFGETVTIERMAKLEDIQTFDNRKPDKDDRHNLKIGNYVIVKHPDGEERLASISFLRADDGFREIATRMREFEDCPLAK